MKVNISTILAWKIINYNIIDGRLTMPTTEFDSEIEKNGYLIFDKEGCNIGDIFTSIFTGLSSTDFHKALYKYLRPEMITQHPQILGCVNVIEAKDIFGDLMEINTEYQYKFHDFLFK